MKKCTICKQAKELAEFNNNKSKKDGLNTLCRDCSNERSRRYYQENKEKHYKEVKKNNRRYVNRNREFVYQYLLKHPCVDCSEDDPVKLDFDHLGDKRDAISRMVNRAVSIYTIKIEIQKCDVRCSNCHRFKTCKELNWWTYRRHYGDLSKK